jgi:hypothetical protein
MARIGLPKKYAKFGFKKGWKLFKQAKAATKRKFTIVKKKSKPPKKSKVIVKKIITQKRRPSVARTKKAVRAVRRRATSFANSKTGTIVIDGLAISTSLITSTVIMNVTPKIKDMHPFVKGGIQFGAGLMTVLFVKNKLVKKAGIGIMSGSMVTTALPYVRRMLPAVSLFGRESKFSPTQLQKMQANMGRPVNMNGNNYPNVSYPPSSEKMGRPVTMSGNRRPSKY